MLHTLPSFLLFLATLAARLSLPLSTEHLSWYCLCICSKVWRHSVTVSGCAKLASAFSPSVDLVWVWSLPWRNGGIADMPACFWEGCASVTGMHCSGIFQGDFFDILFVSVFFIPPLCLTLVERLVWDFVWKALLVGLYIFFSTFANGSVSFFLCFCFVLSFDLFNNKNVHYPMV